MEDPTKITPSKIVFISRADTYFGRILAQHFVHATLANNTRTTNPEHSHYNDDANQELFDLSFLDGGECPI